MFGCWVCVVVVFLGGAVLVFNAGRDYLLTPPFPSCKAKLVAAARGEAGKSFIAIFYLFLYPSGNLSFLFFPRFLPN